MQVAQTGSYLRILCPLCSNGNTGVMISARVGRYQGLKTITTALVELDDDREDQSGIVLPVERCRPKHYTQRVDERHQRCACLCGVRY